MHADVLYHVTFDENFDAIFKHGIRPQKKGQWLGQGGRELGEARAVYAFENLADARRWAMNMYFRVAKKPIIILAFLPGDERWVEDPSPQASDYAGRWLLTKSTIAPGSITRVIPFSPFDPV